jgi:hypothetical protein
MQLIMCMYRLCGSVTVNYTIYLNWSMSYMFTVLIYDANGKANDESNSVHFSELYGLFWLGSRLIMAMIITISVLGDVEGDVNSLHICYIIN